MSSNKYMCSDCRAPRGACRSWCPAAARAKGERLVAEEAQKVGDLKIKVHEVNAPSREIVTNPPVDFYPHHPLDKRVHEILDAKSKSQSVPDLAPAPGLSFVADRSGGCYRCGKWTALARFGSQLPDQGESLCASCWETRTTHDAYGSPLPPAVVDAVRGVSPALADLLTKSGSWQSSPSLEHHRVDSVTPASWVPRPSGMPEQSYLDMLTARVTALRSSRMVYGWGSSPNTGVSAGCRQTFTVTPTSPVRLLSLHVVDPAGWVVESVTTGNWSALCDHTGVPAEMFSPGACEHCAGERLRKVISFWPEPGTGALSVTLRNTSPDARAVRGAWVGETVCSVPDAHESCEKCGRVVGNRFLDMVQGVLQCVLCRGARS